jgi:hypothetical protein
MAIDADLDRLLQAARTHLPGALDSALQVEMYNVVDDFLTESSIWQETAAFITAVGTTDYEIDLENNATFLRLLYVLGNANRPVIATMEEPGVVVLRTIPQTIENMTARVSLTLKGVTSEGWPSIPSWMWQRYREGLLDGLLAKMLVQPAKPYTNERLAIFHGRKFNVAKSRARSEANRMKLYDAQAWRFPKFA